MPLLNPTICVKTPVCLCFVGFVVLKLWLADFKLHVSAWSITSRATTIGINGELTDSFRIIDLLGYHLCEWQMLPFVTDINLPWCISNEEDRSSACNRQLNGYQLIPQLYRLHLIDNTTPYWDLWPNQINRLACAGPGKLHLCCHLQSPAGRVPRCSSQISWWDRGW